jgi:hypothetical protein
MRAKSGETGYEQRRSESPTTIYRHAPVCASGSREFCSATITAGTRAAGTAAAGRYEKGGRQSGGGHHTGRYCADGSAGSSARIQHSQN